MIIVSGTNSKKINDPVFLSARKFMQDRLAKLEAQGPSSELDLEKARYTGLTAKDVQIEPPVSFEDNIVRCCFVSRKTGFLRADILVEHVDVSEIFTEFSVAVTEYADTDTFIAKVQSGEQAEGVVFIRDKAIYGIVLAEADANPDEVMRIMGDIYWDKITVNTSDVIDDETKSGGTFSIEAINIDTTQGNLYIIEQIQALD
ncbi:hypothetical protein AH04_211 [Erwinia phage AH04]|uniref:Uncharacterized protein n=1 Tax=Erwinia phage AH04 TaxID=2869569 RepID=A0AAE7X1Z1_9CAUD|nr:hypothetical protein PQC02_gp103 [Erwinia phage AH04]QZA70686.1 hypothetical protein AH04_211 [Erwinia phage AH04]